MKKAKLLIALGTLAALIIVTVTYFSSNEPESEATASSGSQQKKAPALEVEAVATVDESTTESGESINSEVLATRRMYAAHASLRTEVIDDPDSATNMRIQQEMIMKAIGNAKAKDDQ